MHQTADASSKNPPWGPAHIRHVIPSQNHAEPSPSYVLTQSLYPNPNPASAWTSTTDRPTQTRPYVCPAPHPWTPRRHYITTPATDCQALTPSSPSTGPGGATRTPAAAGGRHQTYPPARLSHDRPRRQPSAQSSVGGEQRVALSHSKIALGGHHDRAAGVRPGGRCGR